MKNDHSNLEKLKVKLPKKLHCYAIKENDQWSACCLDFTLAAQASSLGEAVSRLEIMINDYIRDASEELQNDQKEYFLTRKAPLNEWIRYFICSLFHNFHLIIRMSLVLSRYERGKNHKSIKLTPVTC